jgi:glycosyltransferase involved in cell wall biosynthesis
MNMCKVSILMNCWNGEVYVREAIESVFSQSFSDWEIVFIDNCSTDNSPGIAKSFGAKVKYFKTPYNMPLGEARAFGINKCRGQYLMYLDVDDRYRENTIDTLLNEIQKTNYLVVYSGHRNINSKGYVIGRHNPSRKEGNIFGHLLMQFDVPTASLIMDLKKYKESGQTYDKEIVVSAEYNHYLQLAATYEFKCINGELTDYRIHSGGLTNERAADLYNDRIITLDNIVKKDPQILEDYPGQFREAYARADYYMMRNFIANGEMYSARRILRPHMFLSTKYFVVFICLFIPSLLRRYIFKLKYSR